MGFNTENLVEILQKNNKKLKYIYFGITCEKENEMDSI